MTPGSIALLKTKLCKAPQTRRFVGRAELKKFTEQSETLRATLPKVCHCVMNTMTDVEGDKALSSSYLQVLITGKDGAKLVVCGRYDDTFVKVGGEWRFKEREFLRDEWSA